MLGLTGDPVRQARPGCTSVKQVCLQPGSRAVCRTASYDKRHKAANTSHQAATAFAGGHGAGPCASAAAAAAAAPTAMQDLLVQVVHEEPAHRYPQHTVNLSQMQLHQLQRHDQMMLQQQLEQLHQQHQQRQQQQQQQQQQEQQHAQQLPHQGSPEGLGPLQIGHGDSSAALVQQHAVFEPHQLHTAGQGCCSKDKAEHYAQQDAAPQLPTPHQNQPQLTAGFAEQAGGRHGEAVLHGNGSMHDMRCSTAMPSSSRGRAQLQQAAASTLGAHAAFPPSLQEQSLGSDSRPAAESMPQHSSSHALHQPPRQHAQHPHPHQQHLLERTPAGMPLVRLHRGFKPAQVADMLCSCLLQEQQVVLSAAGADLALMALNCVERAVALQQQRQPGSLVLAAPSFRSSKRPVGSGRCQVYDLVCSLHSEVLPQHQQEPLQTYGQSQLQQQPAAPQCSQQPRPQQQGALAGQQQPHGVYIHHSTCCSSSNGFGGQHARAGAVAGSGCFGSQQQPPEQLDWPWQQPQQQQQQHWQAVSEQHQLPPSSPLLLQHADNGNGRLMRQQMLLQQLDHVPPAQQMQVHTGAGPGSWQLAEQHGQHLHYQQQQQQQQQQHEQAHADNASSHSSGSVSAAHAGHVPPLEAAPSISGGAVLGDAANSQGGPAAAATADMAAVAPVAVVKVAGSSVNFADTLEDALAGPAAAVMLPVAHAKQAVRVLEAVSIVSARLQQRQQRQAWRAQLAEQQVGAASSSSVAGVQLVMQPRQGKVTGQFRSSRGLHVFVYAAPLV